MDLAKKKKLSDYSVFSLNSIEKKKKRSNNGDEHQTNPSQVYVQQTPHQTLGSLLLYTVMDKLQL